MRDPKSWIIKVHLLVMFTGLACMNISAKAQQSDLPWGTSKQPTIITPDRQDRDDGQTSDSNRQNPVPSGSDSYRDNRSDQYSSQGAYQKNPPYQNERDNRGGYTGGRPGYYDNPAGSEKYSPREAEEDQTFSDNEILNAGHRFFGQVSKGLAKVIAKSFSEYGRPNGYILGEEAGGALIAGLRYGEGVLTTKYQGKQKVYWQGPSIGYDFGAEGSKTMILVYDLEHPSEIFQKFTGVNGSAYLVGGIGLTYQRNGRVVLARIQSGVGVRLGANVGYLKYTRTPTWNPF